MAQVINTNVMSMYASRVLNRTRAGIETSVQRLSSGERINAAKDDAAGLAVSERLTAQVRGLNQAIRNANDGLSMAQTAEVNLQETANGLQHIRELAVQAANATLTANDRTAISDEVGQLVAEMQRADDAKFNGKSLLAAAADFAFQIGANAGDTVVLSTVVIASTDGMNSLIAQHSIGTASDAEYVIGFVDRAIDSVNSQRAKFGSLQQRFESIVANLNNNSENISASKSRIRDADYAMETARMTRSQILQQSGMAMLVQANSAPSVILSALG